ncbi:MAG: hypothetical protein JO227_14545 [Acetobacteraceae bacterium]|nr:hypothetical protein [Acetobacteraceae bacterium]
MRKCGLLLVGLSFSGAATAADRLVGYNLTSATDFTGVFLAPTGTTNWGANQALNDADKRWDVGERLVMRGISPGQFDLKVVDRKGRSCIKHGIDLTKDTSFDLRDEDLKACGW